MIVWFESNVMMQPFGTPGRLQRPLGGLPVGPADPDLLLKQKIDLTADTLKELIRQVIQSLPVLVWGDVRTHF